MLPEFPELKRSVLQDATAKVQKLIHRDHPILAEMKTRIQYEGRTMRYEQVGYGQKQEDLQPQSFPINITFEEVPTLTGDNLEKKLEELASAVGEHQMKAFIAKHEEATLMTGNRMDAGGRAMDGALLLDTIETMPVDFDHDGRVLPSNKFLTHPSMMDTYRAAIREIENDTELQSRYRDIQARQYGEWVDRENRRKLVD